jgi:RNA polymerase sigma-70 factor (ECF subfamily)
VEPASKPEELMARYQAGDFAAAETLIGQLSPQLRRFFAVESASRAHADDLLQETWLRIHRVRHTYRPGEPLLPWLYAIARYVRVDHYRKMSRTTARERPLEEDSDTAAAPAAGDAGAEELEALLAPLTSSEREVIEMTKIAGMSLEEVARAMSLTVGAVKQRVHRAYESLRRQRGGMR